MGRMITACLFAAATVAGLLPATIRAAPASISPAEIHDIAESAYLFAYPLVLAEFTRDGAPPNSFAHMQEFPSPSFRLIVLPNADTLYSNAWLDLSMEPVLLHVPDTSGRFYLIQLMDAWTETFASLGKRTTGTSEGWFAIVGPGWRGRLPQTVKRIDAGTNIVWLIGRVQTNTAADYDNVHVLQKDFTLVPLSRYPDGANPPTPTASVADAVSAQPLIRVAQLSAVEFFRDFQKFLTPNPAHAADAPMMKQLARIGLEADHAFETDHLGTEGAKALEAGVAAAVNRLNATVKGPPDIGNNWRGFTKGIGRYGTDYPVRAQIARVGLGALPPEDAIYISASMDKDGRPFDGANKYQLHFSPRNLPPARAFWSLTLYDPAGYFAANAINRYAIGDRDPLQRNSDGGLDLWIQREPPGGVKDHNWLPAPEGRFRLFLRLYWPDQKAIEGNWVPPAVARQP